MLLHPIRKTKTHQINYESKKYIIPFLSLSLKKKKENKIEIWKKKARKIGKKEKKITPNEEKTIFPTKGKEKNRVSILHFKRQTGGKEVNGAFHTR